MLDQFINSTIAHFKNIEPMNAYVQSVPTGVEYPCMLVNKCDINTELINSYMFMNTVTLYVRIFGKDENANKSRASHITQEVMKNRGKIPILNEDGSESTRFIRVEKFEAIDITVDENEIYCVEINFSFDTTHEVYYEEFQKLAKFYARAQQI